MTRNNLIFGGVDTADYGVWITGEGTFAAPERDVEVVSVPGRNGDLIVDNGRWKNIKVTYPAFIPNAFDDLIGPFRSAICKKRGYQRLEDTYHPDEFRMAAFSSGLTPKISGSFNRTGDFDITFNCKPQRFLKSGEDPIQLMPPIVGNSLLMTDFIPAVSDLKVTVSFDQSSTLNLTVRKYDANGTQLSTEVLTVNSGEENTFTYTSDVKYWRVLVPEVSGDNTSVRIRTTTSHGNDTFSMDAVMARNITIQNPTGYPTKPLFECYSWALPSVYLRNKVDGVIQDTYDFNSLNLGLSSNHFWLDCDVQYMYDEDHNNLTDKLNLTTAESRIREGMVFPRLGEEEIMIQMYRTDLADISHGCGLVNIYPYWWKL